MENVLVPRYFQLLKNTTATAVYSILCSFFTAVTQHNIITSVGKTVQYIFHHISLEKHLGCQCSMAQKWTKSWLRSFQLDQIFPRLHLFCEQPLDRVFRPNCQKANGSIDKKDNTGVNTVLNTGVNTRVNTGDNT